MRTNLKVPFAEKEEAKKLGARWDAARKIWYVEDKADMAPFSKWAPSPHETSGAAEPMPKSTPKPSSAKTQQSTGKFIVGSEYAPQARVCECLPWDVCDKCRSTALPN